MRLRFGGARADRCPGDQVAEILRRNRVERLGAGGQAEFGKLEEKFAGLQHSLIDTEGIVHIRVIDIAFPAGGRARLFEIDAHHQVERLADLVGERLQALRIVESGDRIMDRAWSDDDKKARVAAVEDIAQDLTAVHDQARGAGRERQLGMDFLRRRHGVEGGNVDVVDVEGGHVFACVLS
jgi:hypothetical protein